MIRFREMLLGFFVHDVGLKIGALLAAILMFWLTRGATSLRRTLYVDVAYDLPANAPSMVVSPFPDRVRIVLEGSGSQIATLRREDIPPVAVRLNENERHYFFADEQFRVPVGVRVVGIAPASFPVQWSKKVHKSVRVKANFVGENDDGDFDESSLRVEPELLALDGPETSVRGRSVLETEAIDLATYAIGDHSIEVSLAGIGQHERPETRRVRVSFSIRPHQRTRRFRRIEVSAIGPVPRAMRPKFVDIVVRGAKTKVDELEAHELIPIIDTTNLEAGLAHQIPVILQHQHINLTSIQIRPATLVVDMARRRPAAKK